MKQKKTPTTLKELEKAYKETRLNIEGQKVEDIDILRRVVKWADYEHEHRNQKKTINQILKDFFKSSLGLEPEHI